MAIARKNLCLGKMTAIAYFMQIVSPTKLTQTKIRESQHRGSIHHQ